MSTQWLRLWHEMPNDPKWRTIARVSKQSISEVIAVYIHLLVTASNATERGRTQSVCNEDIASALDLECDQVDAIIDAMQGRVLDGDMISGWSKRQVEREDGASERAKAWREAQKAKKTEETNATERARTQSNAIERNRTQTERKRTPDTDTDTDIFSSRDKSLSENTRFADFWEIYPSKSAKPQCAAKWKAKKLDGIAEKIIANVKQRLALDRKWAEGFIPNPLTYINQERWNDPIQNGPQKKPDSQSVTADFRGKVYAGTPEDQLPAQYRDAIAALG